MTHKDHMSAESRAEAIWQDLWTAGELTTNEVYNRLIAHIKAAENDALERAANVVRSLNGWGAQPAPELAEHIASVIRSLQSKDTP